MPLYSVADVIITWLDVEVESSLQFHVIQELLQSVRFQKCVLLDSFPWSQRAGFNISNMQLFTISSSNNMRFFHNIPLLPSPNYITGFGAELFTFVVLTPSIHL